MKYVVVAFYDKDLEAFKLPQCINAPDINALATDMMRGIIKQMPDEKVGIYAAQQMYDLGTYDDETGILETKVPVKVLDCDELLKKRAALKVKEVKIDG